MGDHLWDGAARALGHKLFEIGGTEVTTATLLTVAAILAATFLLSWVFRRTMVGVFRRRGVVDDGNVLAVARLLHYGIMLVGTGVALQTTGFNLNALFAAGAVFAIGIGFAMQNLVQNFVAGVILLVERSIKPGDVLEVEDGVVKVVQMGIRSTIVITRDGEHLIMPNSKLVQSTVTNLTFKGSVYRLRAKVGVVYGADLKQVMATLLATAKGFEWGLAERDPAVLLTGFGNSSVDFEVAVWVGDPWERPRLLSRLNQAIWWALKEREITIAFPQVDVHFDPPVEAGLRALTDPAGAAN